MEISKDDWTKRVSDYHFPNAYAAALKALAAGWKDVGLDPLGALLEWVKWSEIMPLHDVLASVFIGQMMYESGDGLRQDVPLGIKASTADKAAGKAERIPTLELLSPTDIATLKTAGDFIALTGRTSADKMRLEVRCFQWFLKGTAQDNANKYLQFYESHKPNRAAFLAGGPEGFLRGVTTATPYAYATGEGYVQGVMGRIKAFQLELLDHPTA